MRYKVIYTSTTLVDPYIQLPDFPRFADVNMFSGAGRVTGENSGDVRLLVAVL